MAMVLMVAVIFSNDAADTSPGESAKKYRIAYIEANDFWAFSEIMNAIKENLAVMGWKDRIEFPDDARIHTGWGAPNSEKILNDKASELMSREDIDLIITAGTPPTAAVLKVNNGRTPILAIAVSDPVRSKFVFSAKDSGVDNFTARVVPDRFKQMFTLFHKLIRFKKMGLLSTNNADGKVYSNADDAREIGKSIGFEVIEYDKINFTDNAENCIVGINWLIQRGIDAFYQPALDCFDWKKNDVKKILDILTEHKIPVFAREGSLYVKAGALLGFSSIDFGPRGEAKAMKIIRIFQGELPRSLPMIDDAPPKISFNLKVAERIGFDPPYDVLGVSDELFREIALPEERLVN
jgi:ABC-type uncharacterized transport system substrate-binding protein